MLDSTIATLTGTRARVGRQYGVEVEVEYPPGREEAFAYACDRWSQHRDGSLHHGFELVSAPSSLVDIKLACDELDVLFEKYPPLENSPRTSVHVHVNCTTSTFKQMLTRACAYWIFEEYLIRNFCSESRRGNIFCLSISEADEVIFSIQQAIRTRKWTNLSNDNYKYSGLNLVPLSRFGTLEIRIMHGLTNGSDIYGWVAVIDRLMKKADEYKDPRDLINSAKADPRGFANNFGFNPPAVGIASVLCGASNIEKLGKMSWEKGSTKNESFDDDTGEERALPEEIINNPILLEEDI